MEGLLEAAIRLTVPLLLVALGELVSQRSGVINIGLEGMMSAGAYVGYVVMVKTGDPVTAALAATAAGALAATIMVAFAVWGEVEQILVGFAIFILIPGLTSFLAEQLTEGLGVTPLLPTLAIPYLADIPIVGKALFAGNGFYWATVALTVGIYFFLTRTRFGLLMAASGHNPSVALASGVPVKWMRTIAVLICGGMAGLGGASLTIGALGSFSTIATGGRGFIAIAIVILGRWQLGGVVVAALAIGFADACRLRLGGELGVPVQILAMAPWLVMLAMLIIGARWAVAPAGLGANPETKD
jgi:simple sugar transport system permease protein